MAGSQATSRTSWTLKVEFNGELRRLKGWPTEGNKASFQAMSQAICKLFDLPEGPLNIRYRDDEGDLCSLVEATLEDALQLAEITGLLMLSVDRVEPPTPPPAAPQPAAVATPAATAVPAPAPGAAAVPVAVELVPELTSELGPMDATALGAAAMGHFHQATDWADRELSNFRSQVVADFETARRDIHEAKPRLAESWDRFKAKVKEDFKSSQEDMRGAFRGPSSEAAEGRNAQQSEAMKHVSNVTGAAAGLTTALRLAPLRATRLAADSLAAFAGAEAAGVEAVGVAAEAGAPGSAPLGGAPLGMGRDGEAADGVEMELSRFKSQVAGDFEMARKEVHEAVGTVLGCLSSRRPSGLAAAAAPQGEAAQQVGQQLLATPEQQDGPDYKRIIPAVASTLAGVSVATTLVPLRAVRLAVASARTAGGASRSGGQEGTQGTGLVAAEEVA